MNRIFIGAALLLSHLGMAQLSPMDELELDSLYTEWSQNTGPGVAAGLMYGKEISYIKGFGLADVEHNTAITPKTKFQVDHLSRQFTVLALLILEQQGKLKLDDPVRNYVTDLPNYGHDLLLRHLVNHTSGLNDCNTVKYILGKEEDDVFTHQDALRLIRSQKTLNFKPGTSFSYIVSKTELTLIAEVVAKVSEQSFAAFTKEHIFEPLEMKDSQFLEDYNAIIPGGAKSYQLQNEELINKALNQSDAGPTNLFTSVEDMFIWYSWFNYPGDAGLSVSLKRLDEPAQLDAGGTFDSAWGKMTLGREFYHKERGLPCYWQYGLSGGYAANVFRFPEQQLISFVLGNNNRYNGMPAMSMAYHFLDDKFPEPQSIDASKISTKKVNSSRLKSYEGEYWNKKRALARKLFVSNDTLRYARLNEDEGLPMIPLEKGERFQLLVDSDDKIILGFKETNGSETYGITLGDSDPSYYEKYAPISPTTEQLHTYSGSYYSESLGVVYTFSVKTDGLQAEGPDGTLVEFFPVVKDVFRSQIAAFGSINFERDTEGDIDAFTIQTDGIEGLKFVKFDI
ncbi:serine hydrolase domain-containing protein [Flagellimonas flava]|uniref:CubicO group peptidase, beta-lactamase class C family n=1 Tax=Flagellimonas flava TaxID=570519 RepID=A0A1M5NAR9_9FLAO|nr:serine hydrolase domain-containing protein [Allomuricauda flava]SHG86093.1 CubicO group peptidase, beta-lactamase class C family [Allomuricauda flava]